ncbi:sodium-independent sulfate anion transporter isoform X1 [Diabrotica virgifera virgifera]|uniref:Sodium-independent sulfate anion transporter n=1 Tax=Diabrotica virgifera virgifera TaxID=50390 RepID=A0ABM5KIY8_DIAVI|nr:sodium-independent sulfate anion transporter isoform X1 [Diabrotica virgifera virgifera]
MPVNKNELRINVSAHQKSDRDVQGAGGGGPPGTYLSYENSALNASSDTINYNRNRNDSAYLGSNDFIVIDNTKKHSTFAESIKSAIPWAQKKLRSSCSKKKLYRRVPVLNWLPRYNSENAVGDLVAGITVGLTVIPQALAYSNIAGLSTVYGLYSSFLGPIVYIFIGSCKDVPVGPSAISALMTYQATKGLGPEYAILLTFLTGIVLLLMGLFGLGFLIDFVSGPVSSGFTSAVALIIVTSQVKDVLGIHASGNTFVETWKSIFEDIHHTQGWDAMLGVVCIAVLLILRIIGSLKLSSRENEQPTTFQKLVNRFLWLIGTARNAILVIVCGFIGYSFCLNGEPPFKVIGHVPQGLPTVVPPPFSYHRNINGTVTNDSFTDMITKLGSAIIVVPLIAILENIAVCKAFANGKVVDSTQEFIAVGICNIFNSFVQAFPSTGSLSRSAVNNSSGVRTPLGGLYTGILVILALLFFTPYFYYIPKATLAGVIIAAVIFMVEVKVVKPMWRSKKSDLVLGFATFIACLVLALEIGILVGIGINLLFILYHAARPKITVEKLLSNESNEYLMLTPDRCLIFPSVDYVRNLVTKHSLRQGIPVVIDCSHIYGADYTAATVIEILTQDFAARDQALFFFNLKPSVCSVFEGVEPKDFVVFYNEDQIDQLLKDRSYVKKEKEVISV